MSIGDKGIASTLSALITMNDTLQICSVFLRHMRNSQTWIAAKTAPDSINSRRIASTCVVLREIDGETDRNNL